MGFHGTYLPWNIQPWTFLSGNFRSWDFISRKILAFLLGKNFHQKIPLKSYVDFSVIYYIKSSVVALFSVKPMHSVNHMSVKVMHHCISWVDIYTKSQWSINFHCHQFCFVANCSKTLKRYAFSITPTPYPYLLIECPLVKITYYFKYQSNS